MKKVLLILAGAIVAAFLPLIGYYAWEYFHPSRKGYKKGVKHG